MNKKSITNENEDDLITDKIEEDIDYGDYLGFANISIKDKDGLVKGTLVKIKKRFGIK